MPQLTIQQRIWVCLEMARVRNSVEVRRRWPQRFPNVRVPYRVTIQRTFEKFESEGTCHNNSKGNSGRPRTARTPHNIARVRRSLAQRSLRSSRRNGLGLSRSSFLCIVRLDIRFHPYVLIKIQMLRPGDPALRRAFCNRLINTVKQNPGFLDQLMKLFSA